MVSPGERQGSKLKLGLTPRGPQLKLGLTPRGPRADPEGPLFRRIALPAAPAA
jgi:hypothetical protein